jgi:ATP-dependent protease ClpP protease subunit
MEARMNSIIKQRTKLTNKQMTQIRNGELWLFADDCLKYGVVDKIIQ